MHGKGIIIKAMRVITDEIEFKETYPSVIVDGKLEGMPPVHYNSTSG